MTKTRSILSLLLVLMALLCCLTTFQDGNILPEVSNSAYTGAPLPAWQFGIRPYGIVLAVAFIAFCVIVFCLTGKDKRAVLPGYAALTAWLAILLSRLVFVLVNIEYFSQIAGFAACFRLQDGGLSMTGALGGILLGTYLLRKTGPSFRTVATGLPVFVLIARLGESFTSTGLGIGLDDPNFLTVEGDWDYPLNIRLIEAFAALLILIVLLRLISKAPSGSDSAVLFFVILYGTSQILFESLRNDGHMIWGFVRSQQIFAFVGAAVAAGILASRRGRLTVSVISSVCLGGLVFLLEKALDRNWFRIPIFWLYMIFALLLPGYMILNLRRGSRMKK